MKRNLKQFYGDKLGASDGEIGQVKDFYFDDKHWAVRYVVVDTGSWLAGRVVLLSPHAFGILPMGRKVLPVKLTRKQIENSPSMDSHKPVSRQYEEVYYQYYGWPSYWQGDAMWGDGSFPVPTARMQPLSKEQLAGENGNEKSMSAHLRSVQAVIGYQIQAGEEIAGHVTDFVIEAKSWGVSDIVVNTGKRFTGKKVLVPTHQITRISWEESKIFVNLRQATILELPEYIMPSLVLM